MLHLRRKRTILEVWLGSQYILSVEMLLDRFGQSNKFWKKSSNKFWDILVWVLRRSSRARRENVLGTSRINFPGTSLEHQIRTSPGRHFQTSPRRQIRLSPGWSNRIFKGRPGNVWEGTFLGCPGDQCLPAEYKLKITILNMPPSTTMPINLGCPKWDV